MIFFVSFNSLFSSGGTAHPASTNGRGQYSSDITQNCLVPNVLLVAAVPPFRNEKKKTKLGHHCSSRTQKMKIKENAVSLCLHKAAVSAYER